VINPCESLLYTIIVLNLVVYFVWCDCCVQLRVIVLVVQGILSKLIAFINSLPVYWLVLRVVSPAAVSGKT